MQKLILAEDPEKTLWWRLGHFKNVERVAPLIRGLHSSEDNAKKQARQIRYCIEQAEEYFQAAADVSLATQPLLLYYGMASLAWALILFKKAGDYALDRQKSEHQDHGVTRPHLNYGDRNLDLHKVLEAIRTTVPQLISGHQNVKELRGTFGLLFSVARQEPVSVKVVRQKGIVTESTSRVMPVVEVTTKPENLAGAPLSLGRLLMEIPDMVSPFGELDIRPPFAYCSDATIVQDTNGAERLFIVTSRNTEEEMKQLHARFERYEGAKVSDVTAGVCFEISYPKGKGVRVPRISETRDGRLYIYLPEEPEQLPETCSFLGAMFLLGMLVRYYPHLWMYFLDRRHPLVEVVEAFLPIAKRKYPNLILNNLTGDSFIFKHPTK